MNTILMRGDFGTFELGPVNKRIAKQIKKETGEETVLFQTDYDFPGLARSLGWRGKIGREKCDHRGTDGTVDCPECGKTASEFISAAAEWLGENSGRVFRGKGEEYFQI